MNKVSSIGSQNNKHVAVLMGGWSAEREVSFSSGRGVAQALREAGYIVSEIDVTRDIAKLVDELNTIKPDVVFNILHGPGGEDGVIQGVLEALSIPYTFSGVMASAVAMDKVTSKKLFRFAGIPTPDWLVVSRNQLNGSMPMPLPFVIKPIYEGSSCGVRLIFNEDDYNEALSEFMSDDWRFGEELLCEPYIPGREIQVAVMGDKALGAIEICPKEGFYDYEAKYTDGKAIHKMPAPMPEGAYQKVLGLALEAHKSVGCRGVSRVDVRYDENADKFEVLEVNTQPGMTPLSLVPEIAAHVGYSFPELVAWMVENAACDK